MEGDTYKMYKEHKIVRVPEMLEPPKGRVEGVAYSPDGEYLAVTTLAVLPKLSIYKVKGEKYERIPGPEDIIGGTYYGVDFSPDGKYLVAVHTGAPYISIYVIGEFDTFTMIEPPRRAPIKLPSIVVFSPTGKYLAVGGGTPYFVIYEVAGGSFDMMPDNGGATIRQVSGLAFSPDEKMLIINNTFTPYTVVYDIKSSEVVRGRELQGGGPSNSGRGVSFSRDGKFLFTGSTNSPYLLKYSVGERYIIREVKPLHTTEVYPSDIAVSDDGNYMCMISSASPYLYVHRVYEGGKLEKVRDAVSYTGGTPLSVAIFPDSKYVTIGLTSSPYISTYRLPKPVTEKYLVETEGQIKFINEEGFWENTPDGVGLLDRHFEKYGMDGIRHISREEWGELSRPVKIHGWTNDKETTQFNVEYVKKEYTPPQIELTVPDYYPAELVEGMAGIVAIADEDLPRMQLKGFRDIRSYLDTKDTELLLHTDDTDPAIKITAIPLPQLVLPKGDIELALVSKIRNIRIRGMYPDETSALILFSVDSGENWESLSEEGRVPVDITSMEDIKDKGMTVPYFNRVKGDWDEIITEGIVRFAYYLRANKVGYLPNIDRLEMEVDLKGRWKKAIHGKVYDYSYDNDTIYVSFTESGSYKINYEEQPEV